MEVVEGLGVRTVGELRVWRGPVRRDGWRKPRETQRGKLRLDEQMLFVEEERLRHLELVVDHAVTCREMESCVTFTRYQGFRKPLQRGWMRPEGRPGEGAAGARTAITDDQAAGMDSPEAGHGQSRVFGLAAPEAPRQAPCRAPWPTVIRDMTILLTDPFMVRPHFGSS